jgi:uncharacterized membrane protein
MESLGCLVGLLTLAGLLTFGMHDEPRESTAYRAAQGMLFVVLVGASFVATAHALAPVLGAAARLLSN